MTQLLFLGGDMNESSSFYPAQVPVAGDVVMTNPSSQDMTFSVMPEAYTINLAEFTKDIYLGIPSENIYQTFRTAEIYDLALTLDMLTLQ